MRASLLVAGKPDGLTAGFWRCDYGAIVRASIDTLTLFYRKGDETQRNTAEKIRRLFVK
jgi:hypothetical protein